MTRSYAQAPLRTATAANGIDYAYREGGVPLVLLMHFRGNLDNWDPALVDTLAQNRRVVAFDNTGVDGSSGRTPSTVPHGCSTSSTPDHRRADRPVRRPWGGCSPGQSRTRPRRGRRAQAQYDAVTAWGVPGFALLERVTGIQAPVFVANGDNDPT